MVRLVVSILVTFDGHSFVISYLNKKQYWMSY